MLRRFAMVLALCLGTTVGGPLHALGLGTIRIQSGLNQPFSATIPFTALSAQEAESLRVRIASNEDFARAGIERSAYLSSVTIEAITGSGVPRLVIRGRQIVREPLLTLLIDVRAGGPKVLREYTVFLDPPGTVPPLDELLAEPLPLPSDENGDRTVAAAPSSPTEDAPPADRDVTRSPAEYGPIAPGDSLWRIASRLRPDDRSITIEQVMLALYKANPDSFPQGSIRSMVLGSTLRVPEAEEMRTTSAAMAKAEIAKLSGASVPPPAPGSERVPASGEGVPFGDPGAAPAVAVEPGAVATEPADPVEGNGEGNGATPGAPVATLPEPDSVPTPAPAAGEKPVVAPRTLAANAPAGGSLLRALLPALVVLIVLLIAFMLLRSSRQKRAQAEYEAAAKAMAAASSLAASTAPVPRARKSAREELEEVNRRIAEEDDESGSGRRPDSAVRLKPGAAGRSDEGPDPISPFEASTFEISLSDNDPISEAEFHLAYGLYDEAALLLKRAAAGDPDRSELRVKLAETYFAAGKAADFRETAEGLVAQLDPPTWEKLAIMGRQLCPDADLFKGDAGGSAMSVDLALGESGPSAKIDDGLDFRLEELELPGRPERGVAGRIASASAGFDLGEFDLGGIGSGAGADPAAPKAPTTKLADFDLGEVARTSTSPAELQVRLEDISNDLDDPFGDGPIPAGDDVGTKLDLARAYVEMGDLKMARSLLDEVDVQGSGDQKREAALLRERMLG
ncbi:MAG: FimV/HubP family polar landmark protein [Panacagrimonas sp.]